MKTPCRLCRSLLAALGFALLAAGAPAAPQPPFRAQYVIGAAGFEVGTAEVHGRAGDDGRLQVEARADGSSVVGLLFGELGTARFTVEQRPDGDRPLGFTIRVDSPFDAEVALAYDWARGRLRVDYNGERREDTLAADTGDPFALMLALGDARRSGRPPPNFWQTPDREGLRRYSVVRGADETLATPLGPLAAERYDCIRVPRAGEDTLRIVVWLAPSLDWLPVQGTRLRNGSEKARFRLAAWARE